MQPNTNISEFKCAVDAGNIFLKFLGIKNVIADSDFAKGAKWADFNDFKKVLDSKVNDVAKKLFSFYSVIDNTQGTKLPKQAIELLKAYHIGGEEADLDAMRQFIVLKNSHYYVYHCGDDLKWVAYEEPGKSGIQKTQELTTSIINRLIMESKGQEIGFIIPQ